MVKIIVGNIISKIVGNLPEEVHSDLNDTLSYRVPTAIHMPLYKKKKWDGIIRLYYRRRGQSFYTGLLAFVRELLKKYNVEFTITDNRSIPEQNLPSLMFNPPPNFEQRDYQEFTVNRALKFTRGILSVATGGGKTVMVTQIISKIKVYPFIFYVLTKDLMEQAYDVLSLCLNEPIGKIGDGKCDIKKINVCTIQTAIRALNMQNANFKISNYQFDDEDEWDEKGIESAEDRERIKTLIGCARGVYFDECISGDAIVMTENGPTRMEEIVKNKCRFVQTYDGNNIVYKPIKRWWDKGIKDTIDITLAGGKKITCTKDHLFFTKRGWVEARNILKKDRLFFVNVDVEKKLLSQTNIDLKNTYSDIKLNPEQRKSGKIFTHPTSKNFRFANAVVEKGFFPDLKRSRNLSQAEALNMVSPITSRDMTNNLFIANTISIQLQTKNKLYWEHVWAIPVFASQIRDRKIIDCTLHTDCAKKNGQNTKQIFCTDTTLNVEKPKILDLENILSCPPLRACRHYLVSQGYCIEMVKKYLEKKYSTDLVLLGLRGGYATMDPVFSDVSLYIQRDGLNPKMKSPKNGLTKEALIVRFKNQKHIGTLDLGRTDQGCYVSTSGNMFPNAWNTSWKAIKSIKTGPKTRVYDIEVEDTHCFFANGVLVHNCHHASARTCKEVLTASENAYWRFGGSATPYRESGDEIMIQAMFGSKIVDINASYLINRGFLVPPYIFLEPVDSDVDLHSYKKIYEHCIVKNDEFNNHVAKTANHLISRGLSILILVQQYPQGDYLKRLIPNSEFITSRMTSKQRKEGLQKLRERKILCMIATSLADEGLDIPTLDAALLAGGGASATRVNQRIGRTLRTNNSDAKNKNKSIIIIYEHNARFLSRHAKKIRRILKKETRFELRPSKGPDFICDEIDATLGITNGVNNLFIND